MPATSRGSVTRVAEELPRREGPPGRPWSGGGREQLAEAVRRLMELTVTSSPPPAVLADAARQITAVADRMEVSVPAEGPVPIGRFAEHPVGPDEVGAALASAMPFDMVIGSCNPLSPPVEVEFRPPLAIGRVVFSPTYEGAPGCVHGAALAGCFDIMLTAANVLADAAGPTVELSINYRKPTRVGVASVFESWVTRRTDRRVFSQGRLLQDGVVTVEAVGEFVHMERTRIAEMHRAEGRPATAGEG